MSMASIARKIAKTVEFLVSTRPGATDRELAEAAFGEDFTAAERTRVNRECRRLQHEGMIERLWDGWVFRNYGGTRLAVARTSTARRRLT
jgi:hypothetical protein